MEEEIDIYADLPNFNLGDNENLAEKNKKISEKCTNLEKQVNDLTRSLESLQKINNNLEVNLSSLLQTAKAEIARKDRMIAEIRQQLDNIQFRRGEYSRSAKPPRRSPPRRKRENSPKEINQVVQVPDTTEFVCSNPPPTNNDDGNGVKKSRHLDGIVNTVFGERLRRRILEEQEEERKQREQSKQARAELDSKKIAESIDSEKCAESNAQSGMKVDSIKLDCRINSVVRLRDKGSSLGSSSSVNSHEDVGFHKRNSSDRKRQLEDQTDLASSKKKAKNDEGKGKYGDSARHSDKGTRSSFKNSSESKAKGKTCAEIGLADDHARFQSVDERSATPDDVLQDKSEGVGGIGADETRDRHNMVAIRLMLLSEGIDPDLEAKNSADNKEKKIVDDKRQSRKRNDDTSRSRSTSKNRRRNHHRSRSKTPDEHNKGRRRSRQHGDRLRRSRDRFDKRRDLKNKDGDNLSEFSREIYELKERIEHRVDDKGRGMNRPKRNDERIYKGKKSRTPDSSRSGSKERTVHRSRAENKSGRSWSLERRKSRNRELHGNSHDTFTEYPKNIGLKREESDNLEAAPIKASPQIVENPETKSLVSLEDGEIVDSAGSSPIKIVTPLRSVIETVVPAASKNNLLGLDELTSKVTDVKASLPLREIGNSQSNRKPSLSEGRALPITESNRSTGLSDSLNTSKDERIEHIAEFIANFTTAPTECEKDGKSNNRIPHDDNVSDPIQPNAPAPEVEIPKEKLHINTVLHDPTKDLSPLVSPLIENNNVVSTEKVNGIDRDKDWCLIAIDSPVKNFEENRRNRMMAQSTQITENFEKPIVASSDEPLRNNSNDSSEVLHADESHTKIDSASSDKTVKLLVQPVKNTPKTKLAVLTSLRSTYHNSRKEIVLSDINAEQCTKIPLSHTTKFTSKSLSDESETALQSRKDIVRSDESQNMENRRSKSPNLEDNRNCNSSQKRDVKQSANYLFNDHNDSKNVTDDEATGMDIKSEITSTKKIDATSMTAYVDETNKKGGKSKGNSSKTRKEMGTKISGDVKPELCNASKIDAGKSIGSKNKAGCRGEKTEDCDETNIKCSENGDRTGKNVPKVKAEGSNGKQKKEPRKLVVFARRRQPVHLEDSSTSSNVTANKNSIGDGVNSEKTEASDIESGNSLDLCNQSSIEQGKNEEQTTVARNDSGDHPESKV